MRKCKKVWAVKRIRVKVGVLLKCGTVLSHACLGIIVFPVMETFFGEKKLHPPVTITVQETTQIWNITVPERIDIGINTARRIEKIFFSPKLI